MIQGKILKLLFVVSFQMRIPFRYETLVRLFGVPSDCCFRSAELDLETRLDLVRAHGQLNSQDIRNVEMILEKLTSNFDGSSKDEFVAAVNGEFILYKATTTRISIKQTSNQWRKFSF